MRFATYKAAAAFARSYARRVNASTRICRIGAYWTVVPSDLKRGLYDPEIEAMQRAEGRARYLAEIDETTAHIRACRNGASY